MKKWRLIGGIALMFILGILVGSTVTQAYHKYRVEHVYRDPAARKTLFLKRLTRDLGLTGEQQKEFKSILDDLDRKREAFEPVIRAEIKKNLDDSFMRMKERLNPDQQQRLEELRAKHDARMKKSRTRFF